MEKALVSSIILFSICNIIVICSAASCPSVTCQNNPCMPGTCSSSVCECAGTSATGCLCEITCDASVCDTNIPGQCQNGGTCMAEGGDSSSLSRCMCDTGYTGCNCELAICLLHEDIENGTVTFPPTPTNATYSCNEGYELEGVMTRNCINGTFEGVKPTCERIICPELSEPSNGMVSVPDDRFVNVEARYSCNDGYDLVGGNTRTCQSDGMWDGEEPTCEQIMCPRLSIRNGIVTAPTNLLVNVKAVYSCNDGYNLVGGNTRTCQSDGTWDGQESTCKPIMCSKPSAIRNGMVSFPEVLLVGTRATYSCNDGYNLAGARTRVCQIEGIWNRSKPRCLQSTVVPPDPVGLCSILKRKLRVTWLSSQGRPFSQYTYNRYNRYRNHIIRLFC